MATGPGRSDCFRIGVTYGYRECLRKGRVRISSAADLTVTDDVTNRRRAYMCKSVVLELPGDFDRCACRQKAIGVIHKAFLCVSGRPYIEKFGALFSLRLVGFFSSFRPYFAAQKTSNLLCDGRFTALMPAEMSYSNRLGRPFGLRNLMPIRHRVGVYGIRRRSRASE